jgi:hypothetical protein
MRKEISVAKFDEFVHLLEKKEINCRANLMNDFEVVIECGWNYPDKMFNKVYKQAEKLEIQDNLCVCADQSGGNVVKTIYVNNGPQHHNKW